ncbi:MAG: hypothetical protein JOZ69_20200, partial [Myxococcales bacterium]|nr:hypothetical protein [Myxococcales bacterium]
MIRELPAARGAVALALALGAPLGCNWFRSRPTSAPAGPGTSAQALARDPGSPPPVRDDGRLPATAVPRRYDLSLRVDPSQPRYAGTATILVDVAAPTSYLVLHARDMNVERALVRARDQTFPATPSQRVAHGGARPEELVLTLARPLPAGPASIEIAYDAPFAADLAGLYRVEEANRWYAYTQFEVADARRAFPCFDEPGWKTPYDVRIASPKGTLALTNGPETETSREESADGFVVHRFAASAPLPTYLVAFAV